MDIIEAHLPLIYSNEELSVKLFEQHPTSGTHDIFPHKHTQLEICLVKSGVGKYKTPNKEYSMMPGDVFFFRSNEVHYITEVSPEEEMDLLNIQFEPHLLWASNNSRRSNALMNIISKSQIISNRLDRDNPHIGDIIKLILNIENEFLNKSIEYLFMIEINLSTIFVNLIRYFYSNNLDDNSFQIDISTFDAIEASMVYMQEHLTEPINLDELAAVANMSKAYYSTLFKKINGITPWDHIVSKRIDLAISCLQNESQTMLELALKCGFNSTANFNRAFKKYTGKTPSEYKAHISAMLEQL